jgi:exopolysaccharide production protein ExoQ
MKKLHENKFEFMDVITLVMLIVPINGMFYPFESYLAAGSIEGDVVLSVPVNPISLIIISIYVCILYFLIRRKQRFINFYPMYIFIFFAALTYFWSPDPGGTAIRVARLPLLLGLSVTMAQYHSFRKTLLLMSVGFLLSGAVSILMSVAFPNLGLSHLGNGYENAWRGAAVHKNFGGLTFSIGVILPFYAYRARCIPFWMLFACAGTCGLMLVKGESATSLTAFVFAAVIGMTLYLIKLFSAGLRIPIALILVVPTVILGSIIWLNLGIILDLSGRDMTFTGRSDIWAAVFAAILEHPLRGYGYAFWVIDSPDRQLIWGYVGDTAAHSHNTWLDAWLQTGLFGLLAIAFAFVSTLLKLLWFCLRSNDESGELLIAIIIFLFVRSFTEVEFTDPAPTGLFWLVWVSTTLKLRRRTIAMFPGTTLKTTGFRNRFVHPRYPQIRHASPDDFRPRPMQAHSK